MKSIKLDLSAFENPIHRGMHALRELRRVGVPVVGVLWPETVESGTLTVSEEDISTGEVEYTWQE